jgi:hypothetical protein
MTTEELRAVERPSPVKKHGECFIILLYPCEALSLLAFPGIPKRLMFHGKGDFTPLGVICHYGCGDPLQ